MPLDRSIVRLSHGGRGSVDRITDGAEGIAQVWPLTVAAYAMQGMGHAECRVRKDVVVLGRSKHGVAMPGSHSDVLPSKSEILAHWAEDIHRYVEDFDERRPVCWACNWDWGGRFVLKSTKIDRARVAKRWENAPLQRCHIVPRSLGGDDSCRNLFLMCKECHDLAPNTPIREVFFRWTTNQFWMSRQLISLQTEARMWGVDDSNAEELTKTINSPEFKLWADAKSGLHRPQSGYSGIGKRITPSTYLGLAWWWMRLKSQGTASTDPLAAKGSDRDATTA